MPRKSAGARHSASAQAILAVMSKTPREVLKEVFGYDSFRPLQEEIIGAVLEGRDVLAVMPTGGGKSLCYQVPAIVKGGLTLVVSPLIALMRDQVAFLRDLGVEALVLNSSLTAEEWRANAEAAATGAARRDRATILYLAPETLASERTHALLSSVRVSLLAVDEAHCISEWGHDFRPEYRALGAIRAELVPASRAVPCLALTATATARVREEIRAELRLKGGEEFVAGFDRPNIFLEVKRRKSVIDQIAALAAEFPDQSGIVYCFSRARAEDVAADLSERGLSALPYHAGLPGELRSRTQDAFIADDVRIIAATTAFGMGIDKPDVRFVVHADLPKSVEQYYQEIGRAGRDGLPSRALLLYSFSDAMKIRGILADKEGDEAIAAELSLRAMLRFAESATCRRASLLAHFGDSYPEANCGGCDVCAFGADGDADEEDVTTQALKFLSCVKRTGERYGAGHVIDVLEGSKNERVLALGHAELSTWGIGKEWTKAQWSDLARQLVRKGYLAKDEEFGVLALTEKSYAAFRERGPIRAVVLPAGKLGSRKAVDIGAKQDGRRNAEAAMPEDRVLETQLRALRKKLADSSAVPPYVVFSDRSLYDLMAKRPASMADLLGVFGFGTVKVERYGKDILALISETGSAPKERIGERDAR
jgi:ATP-dependent DNA helicase RecQ